MKVPLKMDTFHVDNDQFLRFWYNGKSETIKSPVLPYVYSKQTPPRYAQHEKVQKQLLYGRDYKGDLYKVTFPTTHSLKQCSSYDFFESNIKLKDRVYLDRPDLLEEYAHEKLVVLSFDIETDSYLTFPNAKENAIIAFGTQRNGDDIGIDMAESHDDDYDILANFIKTVEKVDPDVYAHYNGTYFDWPFIFDRCDVHGFDKSVFCRDDRDPFVRQYVKPDGKIEQSIAFGGRVNYDILHRSVMRDQYLFKAAPKNKQMKTIARLYNLDNVIQEPKAVMSNMRSIVNTEQLHDYLYSDIRCTTFLCNMYMPALLGMAEQVQIPFDECISSSPAYIPEILFSREFGKRGIVSDMTVAAAYPFMSENKQGALVGCFKPGLYRRPLRKWDVISYYPNLIRTLNLCPTTTKIVEVREQMEPYNARMTSDNFLILSIPDDKAKRQVIIEIDFNKRGFASSFVDENMEARLQMKREMKKLNPSDPQYSILDVNQLNTKVIMNSVTGYFGMQSAKFGSLACYIAITGTGRYLIDKLIGFSENCVALDTDGIVVDTHKSIEEANEWLHKYVLENLHVPKNYIQLEEETFKRSYFREGSKQYLLIDDDELVIHGISFKGSNLPKLFSNIIEDIGYKMLTNEGSLRTDIDKYYDRAHWTLEDLQKNVKVRPAHTYATGNPIGKQLALEYEKRFSTPIKSETNLSYVKTKHRHGSQYRLATIFDTMADIQAVDYNYYTEIVDSALERLGLENEIPRNRSAGKQVSLFDFAI